MKKRSKFDTDFDAIPFEFFRSFDVKSHLVLNEHLRPKVRFAEPCAGYGDLVYGLEDLGHECVYASELVHRPEAPEWVIKDAMELTKEDIADADCIITNPPWKRKILHPMIDHFVSLGKPVWLIFEADWMHTKQSIPFMDKYITDIVSIGRLKWIPNSKYGGLKDCAWYRFSIKKERPITFHARA